MLLIGDKIYAYLTFFKLKGLGKKINLNIMIKILSYIGRE